MAQQTTFNLIVTNVDNPLFEGEVVSVTVPGSEGIMTILAHHEPFVSLLKDGNIVVRKADGEENFEVKNGVLEVSNNQVTILL